MLTVGCGACTTSVTDTETGLPVAPVAAIFTVAGKVPADRVAGLTETDNVAGAVPDADENPTQAAPVEAIHESVPLPPFVIETRCAAGAALPVM